MGVDHWEPDGSRNKLERAARLLKALRDDNGEDAREGALELARVMLAQGKADPTRSMYGQDTSASWWQSLRDAIAADGWEFDEATDRLVPTAPGLQVADEVSWIENDLQRRGWTTAMGHYRQALDAFALSKWASANGQLRAFFEDLLRQAGGTTAGTGSGQVQKAFDNLEAAGSLVKGEAEFGKKLWALLHANGSLPGLSDEDESRFRLLTLTGYTRYLLNRI